jgi:exonuclease VII small subunit
VLAIVSTLRYTAPSPPTTVGPTEETSIMTDTTRNSTDNVADKFAGLARDTAYVLIGAGLLTVQQLQVRRRDLSNSLADRRITEQFGFDTDQLQELVGRLEAGWKDLDQRIETVESKLDAAIESIEGRLPEQAGALLGQAHDAAKAARQQVRSLIRTAA